MKKRCFVTCLLVLLFDYSNSQKLAQEEDLGIDAYKNEILLIITHEKEEALKEQQIIATQLKASKQKHEEERQQAPDLYKQIKAEKLEKLPDSKNLDKDTHVIQDIKKNLINQEVFLLCDNYLDFCIKHKYYPKIIKQYDCFISRLSCYKKYLKFKEFERSSLNLFNKLIVLGEQYADRYKIYIELLAECDILKYKIKKLNNRCVYHKDDTNLKNYQAQMNKQLKAKYAILNNDWCKLKKMHKEILLNEKGILKAIKGHAVDLYK